MFVRHRVQVITGDYCSPEDNIPGKTAGDNTVRLSPSCLGREIISHLIFKYKAGDNLTFNSNFFKRKIISRV